MEAHGHVIPMGETVTTRTSFTSSRPSSWLIGCLVLCAGVPATLRAESADEPIRGMWVADLGFGETESLAATRALVARAKQARLNTLFVVTWNRGYTHYPSEIMRQEIGAPIHPRLAGRDPLREMIEAAHAEGIAVHAWFEFGFSCSYRNPDGGTLLAKHPAWAALDAEGKLVSRNGFQWMNAFDPEVQDFLISLLVEVATQYDIDGVQGDDRLPALPNSGGYDPLTVRQYADDHEGASPPENDANPAWTQWRADRLSDFAARAYRKVKQAKPGILVTWAPSVYPWSKANYLQDWPRWLRDGTGDMFFPQIYRREIADYRRELDALAKQVPPKLRRKVAPGMLVSLAAGYDLPSEQIAQMVALNREYGFSGEVFFYHAGLWQHAEAFQRLYEQQESSTVDVQPNQVPIEGAAEEEDADHRG